MGSFNDIKLFWLWKLQRIDVIWKRPVHYYDDRNGSGLQNLLMHSLRNKCNTHETASINEFYCSWIKYSVFRDSSPPVSFSLSLSLSLSLSSHSFLSHFFVLWIYMVLLYYYNGELEWTDFIIVKFFMHQGEGKQSTFIVMQDINGSK